jgi:3-phenylpropionate/trans-cinnamate dioxygenase ferredoxin subunit
MSDFVKVADVSEIPDGEKLLVEADDRLVIVFRLGDDFYCIDDVCTHDGGTLSDGPHEGCEIMCPRHGARFDVRTGAALSMPATQPTTVHQVRIDGDDVLVKINED